MEVIVPLRDAEVQHWSRTALVSRIRELEEALSGLIGAAGVYWNEAGAHEELFNARDYQNFERLSIALAAARVALGEDENG